MISKLVVLLALITTLGVSYAFALPSPTDSLNFNNSEETNFILKGNSLIISQENPSLKLNGIGDYLILDSQLPEKLYDFSISVWIKPDYKKGAPSKLSIVSESHAFDLSINNDKIDKNTARFSIFDGIKWHHVDSKSEIKDSWTHLAATYSEEKISIFINGVEENSVKVDGRYSLTHTLGIPTQHSYNHIQSSNKILIGAYSPLIRADGIVKNNFSGQVDDLKLYDDSLSANNISEIYKKNRVFQVITPLIKNAIIPEIGITNEYGFEASQNFHDNKKIESIAYQGYKISKDNGGFYEESIAFEPSNKQKDSLDFTPSPEIDNTISSSKSVEMIGPSTPEEEKTISAGNSVTKLVRVEPGATSTFSDLPTMDSGIVYNWKLFGVENGQMIDYSDNLKVSFTLVDSNSDETLDRAEWTVINNIVDFYLISDF
jgi:hypothetical protein